MEQAVFKYSERATQFLTQQCAKKTDGVAQLKLDSRSV